MIRVFITDDHVILREGLRRVLEEAGDIAVVGEAGDGEELLRRAASERFDVLLLDLSLPGRSGIEILRDFLAIRPSTPVLVLSMHAEDQLAVRVLHAGAAGFLSKVRTASTVIDAVRRVSRRERYVTPELAELLLEPRRDPALPPHHALSNRQLEVLILIGKGRTPSEIGHLLDLRATTVSTHLSHIKLKLGVSTHGEIAQYALTAGLLER